MKEINLIVKENFTKLYQNGYPLIDKDKITDINALKEEGQIVNLITKDRAFIAKGYYGRQNKGYGWILSHKKHIKFNIDFFKAKFINAKNERSAFFNDKETTCFRFFNDTGDGIGGLTIDHFNGYYLVTWYSQGIYKFKNEILQALNIVTKPTGIYNKKRFDQKGQYLQDSSDFISGQEAPKPLIVKENGINYAIYLDDGAMVGIFLDQREVRAKIKNSYAKGKSLLNTFSYTGAFSIAAAVGKATKTTSVDLAKRSLPKTKENFLINNIDPSTQNIIVTDVFDYFKFAKRKAHTYDIVILDPPSFARSKKRVFSVAKDYSKLIEETIDITNQNGIIVASTNYANLDLKKFKAFIDKAFKTKNTNYEILQTFSLPKDFKVSPKFKEGNYLKVLFIKLLK